MKRRLTICSIAISFFLLSARAQTGPADALAMFDKSRIKSMNLDMAVYLVQNGRQTEISSFLANITVNPETIQFASALYFTGSGETWTDTSIAASKDLRPLYRSSYHGNSEWAIVFDKNITGYSFNKKTQKQTPINETISGHFVDSYLYPYLLASLPLNSGYKTEIPVFDFKPETKGTVKKARIEEVKNSSYKSQLTGEHKCWQVTVFEEATGETYHYYIDKNNGQIRKIEIFTKTDHLLMLDRETEQQPFKAVFDYPSTLALIKNGNSTINGQVFARDNQAAIKGIAILNVNKKQYAQPGTVVVLIPYTEYYKQWIKANDEGRKKGLAYPLSKEAAACIKTTTVYDDDGHFEFTNLMPGEYLLYTEFSYIHRSTHTEVVGYTDTYINGMFAGSYANTNSYSVDASVTASVKKTTTIKKEKETVTVKLKKTL